MDRAILGKAIDKFAGGPVGGESLAAAVGESSILIGEVYEPYLLQEGFVVRTARGRVATQRAYAHLPHPPRPAFDIRIRNLRLNSPLSRFSRRMQRCIGKGCP